MLLDKYLTRTINVTRAPSARFTKRELYVRLLDRTVDTIIDWEAAGKDPGQGEVVLICWNGTDKKFDAIVDILNASDTRVPR